MKKWYRRVVVGAGVAYPLALLTTTLLLRYVGERWWATGVALYLPRLPLAAPLLVLVPLLVAHRMPRLLGAQAVAVVVLAPLLGFVAPGVTHSPPAGVAIRILSYNVDSGFGGYENIAREIAAYSPDVVLLQEAYNDTSPIIARLHERYAAVESSTQFVIATSYPIVSTTDPERVEQDGRQRSPRFMRHILETPLGTIALYNVHPISPREGFHAVRGDGLRHQILSGQLFEGAGSPVVQANSELRALQVTSFSEMAAREPHPVVIAGDTNLPVLSPVLASHLARYRDGFVEAGWGLGYTFPSRHPWMRIDRVMVSNPLRVVHFDVGGDGASDHRCVVAELVRHDD